MPTQMRIHIAAAVSLLALVSIVALFWSYPKLLVYVLLAVVAVFGVPSTARTFHVCSPGGSHSIRCVDGRWHIAARPERLAQGYLRDDAIHLLLAGLTESRDLP